MADAPVPKDAVAFFWDGSTSEAGRIIEWIEAAGGTGDFRETNETVHRRHPEIRVYTGTGKKLAVAPDEWVVHINDGFQPMSQIEFETAFPRVTK